MVPSSGRQAWDDWAQVDPLWAIMTDPAKLHGQWDLDEFFRTGQETIDAVMVEAHKLGLPAESHRAIDFGCGIGRLTRAISTHFDHTCGLDVAPTMIAEAQRLNSEIPGCEFAVQDGDDLARFANGAVDFVCCLLVLQHIPSRPAIERYLREFMRILAPGGLAIIQLPGSVAPPVPPTTLRARLALRRRFTGVLRRLGASPKFLYDRLGWTPDMPMSAIARDETVAIFEAAGGKVLRSTGPTNEPGGVESFYYYVTVPPA